MSNDYVSRFTFHASPAYRDERVMTNGAGGCAAVTDRGASPIGWVPKPLWAEVCVVDIVVDCWACTAAAHSSLAVIAAQPPNVTASAATEITSLAPFVLRFRERWNFFDAPSIARPLV